jgi:hypothetical protein
MSRVGERSPRGLAGMRCPSIHLKAKHLVRTLRAERVLAWIEALVHLDSIEVPVHPLDVEPDRSRLLLRTEEDFAMIALDVQTVEPEFIGRQLVRLHQENRRRQRSAGRRTGSFHHVEDIVLLLLLLGGFRGFRRDQVVRVFQVRQIRLGRPGTIVFLGEGRADRGHQEW